VKNCWLGLGIQGDELRLRITKASGFSTARPYGRDILFQALSLRANALELLANLRLNLEASENLSEEDRELIMNLSPAYLQWRDETLREGMHSGIRLMVESLLEVKFGAINRELSQIVEPLMQLEAKDRTQLLMQLSREELLARFGKSTL